MKDIIEWRVKPRKGLMAELPSRDTDWTEFCTVLTDEKTMHGTARIIVEALNQRCELPPKMEYRLKEKR